MTVLGAASATGIDVPVLIMGLLGGLALFLFGMEKMSDALKAVAGERMKSILARLTTNRFMGVVTGAFVTAVIQSSSVTTVLVVGFISAGLMSLAQSMGVIMGANVGTTITAQIIAFKVTKYALLMVAVGFAMEFLGKKEKLRQYGAALFGLGLVFFGMAVMGDTMRPLRSYQPFLDWMVGMESPVIGILAGAAFTALVQSSSATTGIVIVMASQGVITLAAGIALIFGANVGTCVTALLAAIGKPREALRAATAHVLFNILGVVIWIPIITHLADVVTSISPQAVDLTGADRLAAETPRQIANAHTVFNIVNTIIFVPFAAQLARLVERMVPDRPIAEAEIVRARYLDTELLSTPTLALSRVRLELLHLGERVAGMFSAVIDPMFSGSRESLAEIAAMDEQVDALHGHIVRYLSKISRAELSESQTNELLSLMEATNNLESIGDIVEIDLVNLGEGRIEREVTVSEETQSRIRDVHRQVLATLGLAVQSVAQDKPELAQQVVDKKSDLNQQLDELAKYISDRLVADEPNRLATYAIETDMLEQLKRVYYFSKRVARVAVRTHHVG